jgi:hypothetical protein
MREPTTPDQAESEVTFLHTSGRPQDKSPLEPPTPLVRGHKAKINLFDWVTVMERSETVLFFQLICREAEQVQQPHGDASSTPHFVLIEAFTTALHKEDQSTLTHNACPHSLEGFLATVYAAPYPQNRHDALASVSQAGSDQMPSSNSNEHVMTSAAPPVVTDNSDLHIFLADHKPPEHIIEVSTNSILSLLFVIAIGNAACGIIVSDADINTVSHVASVVASLLLLPLLLQTLLPPQHLSHHSL